MNTLRSLLIPVCLILLTSSCGAEVPNDWELESAQGGVVRLSEVARERPVIVLFWATWCPYCKALMPHLQSIQIEYGDDVEILAVHINDDADPAEYVAARGYDFTVLLDGDDVAERYDVTATPGVLIIDQQQTIRFDLRNLPPAKRPAGADAGNHSAKAGLSTPYWAAEIRKSLDAVLLGRSQ